MLDKVEDSTSSKLELNWKDNLKALALNLFLFLVKMK